MNRNYPDGSDISVVSIGCKDEDPCKAYQPQNPSHLRFVFNDVRWFGFWTKGDDVPKEHHVQKLLNHADRLAENEDVVFHCQAGVSRSTAMAWAFMVHQGWNYKEALHAIYTKRDLANPNTLLIRYADHLLNMDGKMVDFVDQWPIAYGIDLSYMLKDQEE